MELSEQEIIRRKKLSTLKELGVDPFGKAFKRTHLTNDIKKNKETESKY